MPPLEHNEKILYTARKHWLIFAGETALLGILAVLPGLFLFAPHLLPAELVDALRTLVNLQSSFVLIVLLLWTLLLLLLWLVFFMLWTDYYLDAWFVTNLRVIAIEQRGLFNRRISTFRLDMIQDVTVEVPGILATALHFGTVKVSTASDYSFTFKGVARPYALKERIMEGHHQAQREKQEIHMRSA